MVNLHLILMLAFNQKDIHAIESFSLSVYHKRVYENAYCAIKIFEVFFLRHKSHKCLNLETLTQKGCKMLFQLTFK